MTGRRSDGEVRALAEDLANLYRLGGPPIDGSPSVAVEPGRAHEAILAVLDHCDGRDPREFLQVLEHVRIASPSGLRAFLRLVGSSSAAMALAWVLDEPDAISGEDGHPPARDEVLDAACSIAWWDKNTDRLPRW